MSRSSVEARKASRIGRSFCARIPLINSWVRARLAGVVLKKSVGPCLTEVKSWLVSCSRRSRHDGQSRLRIKAGLFSPTGASHGRPDTKESRGAEETLVGVAETEWAP